MTEHHVDFERNGHTAKIKLLTHRDKEIAVSDLMVWPTLNEPPLAIECNRTVRKLYLSERQVVRSVFVRGIDHIQIRHTCT